jgi:hypothetical protein
MKLSKTTYQLLSILAFVLIFGGLKLTSIESGPYHIQNDGYSLTGGIMTMVGGLIIGYSAASQNQKSKKRKGK